MTACMMFSACAASETSPAAPLDHVVMTVCAGGLGLLEDGGGEAWQQKNCTYLSYLRPGVLCSLLALCLTRTAPV